MIVVNKADHPALERTRAELAQVLSLADPERRPVVIETVATEPRGVDELWAAVEAHQSALAAGWRPRRAPQGAAALGAARAGLGAHGAQAGGGARRQPRSRRPRRRARRAHDRPAQRGAAAARARMTGSAPSSTTSTARSPSRPAARSGAAPCWTPSASTPPPRMPRSSGACSTRASRGSRPRSGASTPRRPARTRTSRACSRPPRSPAASPRRSPATPPWPAYATIVEPASHHPYPETDAVLAAVDELGVRQLVLSNHVWELPEICRSHGWVPPLTDVLTSARLGVEKPHPESYAAAIAAAGCPAGEILFVGDTYEADVAGPERAGMQALLVRRPHPEARRYADDLHRRADPAGRDLGLPWPPWSASTTSSARAPSFDGVAAPTPVLSAGAISRWTGTRVLLKAENLQRTGAFKLRGAVNRMSTLTDDERARGVVAASAGNHAQGVALAATALGVSSRVYMPVDAPLAKQVATAEYGAEVVLRGRDVRGELRGGALRPRRPRARAAVRRRGDHRRPGHDRARAARAGAGRRHDRRPARRRRPALGHRRGHQGAAARRARDRGAGRGLRVVDALARGRASRRHRAHHDGRRRHRGTAARRHHVPARAALRGRRLSRSARTRSAAPSSCSWNVPN